MIENPASVVKELMENAADAGATHLTIEIERGGFFLIRVSDNGCGMKRDDLILSIERHATSKIKKAEDLSAILTMGFRGEALASIASISNLKMITAASGEEVAHSLSAQGGRVREIMPAARKEGTTIDVSSLFYNVPARLSFQKSPLSSQNEIARQVKVFALAHPNIALRFYIDGKEKLHFSEGCLEKRREALLGNRFIQESLTVDYKEEGCKITGALGAPLSARPNRGGQFLFLNGRNVVCWQISRMVEEEYGTRIGSHRYPIFHLDVHLPPEWIDVNVHPQKREVRLKRSASFEKPLRAAIRKAFEGKNKPQAQTKVDWKLDLPLDLSLHVEDAPLPKSFVFQERKEELPIIGLHGHYLITHAIPSLSEEEEGIVLIDLQGALARILYEKALSPSRVEIQMLSLPQTLEFLPHEAAEISGILDDFQKVGISLRPFGEHCFILEGLSPDIQERDVKPLILESLHGVKVKISAQEREKKLALHISSYARSQKTGWTVMEAKEVVNALLKTSSPRHCPKGKRTIVTLDHAALEALFKKSSH